LRDADAGNLNNTASIISTYPLEKYFEISNRLLKSFQEALDERRLDETYIYGIRFCSFSVQALPKHPKYDQPRYKNQRLRNSHQVDKVLKTMEIVTLRMDVEETIRRQQEQERVEAAQKRVEEEEKRQEAERQLAKEEAARRRAEEAEENKRLEQKNVEQSAYAKLQAMKERMMTTTQQKEEKVEHQEHNMEPPPTKNGTAQEISKESTKTKKQPSSNKIVQKKTTKRETSTPKPKQPAKPTSTKDATPAAAAATPKPATTSSTTVAAPKPSPRRRAASTAEEKTLEQLERTIESQEARLEQISTVQIPTLLRQAKRHLREGNRKAALSCVRKKRKLEQMMDISKGAIFHLETQIFQIENAMEDRQVYEALQAASKAMEGLHKTVGVDAETLQEDLTSLATVSAGSSVVDVDVDEEELLKELEQWTTPQKKKRLEVEEDDISILSLPKVPSTREASYSSTGEPMEQRQQEDVSSAPSSSVRNLLKAVLG
jgi:hypothetical protein